MPEETFADVVREIVGNKTQRAVAKAAGVSHPYVNDWLQDRIPTLKTLIMVAYNLQRNGMLSPDQRARLFRTAGYIDPGASLRRLVFTQESPTEWFEREIGRRYLLYSKAGYQVPVGRMGYGGNEFESEEDAEAALEDWEAVILELNPGKPRLTEPPESE